MNGLELVKNKTIAISGINLFEGGPLSIFYDFLDSVIRSGLYKNNSFYVFVHKLDLFTNYKDFGFTFIELPKSRKSYFKRLHYEHSYFKKFSKINHINYWISLHDITPSVYADHIYTYCHNPSPFRKTSFFDLKMGIKNILFPLFYSRVYKKNIKKTTVIVQQEWIRNEFIKRYKISNVIVAKPNITIVHQPAEFAKREDNDTFEFIFPSFPRVFKNFETILEATKLLNTYDIKRKYIVSLTLSGNENKYSRYLYKKYKNVENVKWIGLQSRDALFKRYSESSCLIFPSKSETWGLPISEYKQFGKAMFLADLPYSHETIGNYDKVSFFEPSNYQQLSKLMEQILENCSYKFDGSKQIIYKDPFVNNWDELVHLMFKK